MHAIVDRHRAELAELCHKYGVSKLEVFGSACTESFDPARSDVDLIAWFDDKGPGYADRYLNFANAAERVLRRQVDLITPRSIGKDGPFRRAVDASRVVIYERGRVGEAA